MKTYPIFKSKYAVLFLTLFVLEIYIALYSSDGWVRGFLGDIIVVILLYSLLRLFTAYESALSIAKLSFLIACMAEILQAFEIGKRLGLTG